MIRILLFLLAGVALGYGLTFMASVKAQTPEGAPRGGRFLFFLMLLRLVVFVAVVGWLTRSFGPVAGASVLAGAVVTRWALLRTGSAPSGRMRLPR